MADDSGYGFDGYVDASAVAEDNIRKVPVYGCLEPATDYDDE